MVSSLRQRPNKNISKVATPVGTGMEKHEATGERSPLWSLLGSRLEQSYSLLTRGNGTALALHLRTEDPNPAVRCAQVFPVRRLATEHV